MRYVVIGINVPITPAENTEVPRIGTILWSVAKRRGYQWVRSCAAQPYQNNPIGMNMCAKIMGGRRYSGFLVPCFSAIRVTILSENWPIKPRPTNDPIPNPRYASPEVPPVKP